LQAQLKPHFLFNSLNTVAVLVRGGENQNAARVVEQLSDVLRRTLGHREVERALEDELSTASKSSVGRASVPEVIFLTAYDAFAIRAFEAEALDYLLKPVSEERFAATIEHLMRRLRKADASIAVATPRGVRVFPLVEVDWIEAADNYARVWVGGRSYLVRRSLSELERSIAAQSFARAHRQALVRIAAVRALEERDSELIAVLDSEVEAKDSALAGLAHKLDRRTVQRQYAVHDQQAEPGLA